MAGGIYLHIPFCKQACHYCDFHFATNLGKKDDMLNSLHTELRREVNFLSNQPISSIYFGGGTPSLLEAEEIEALMQTIQMNYAVEAEVEVTLECNPDDLSAHHCEAWIKAGINRLSIGIQSFDEEALKWMNRAHDAAQAENAISLARSAGFNNITVDLIYGIPVMTDEKWLYDVQKVIGSGVQHLSAYALTVEKGTPLHRLIGKGMKVPVVESAMVRQYDMLQREITLNGWEQYEISNYCKGGAYSKHNTSYWQGLPYLGVGPSAHSFNGKSRFWNAKNNAWYIRSMSENTSCREQEILSNAERYNERIMTGLRTKWGVDLLDVSEHTGYNAFELFGHLIEDFVKDNLLEVKESTLYLTPKGMLMADRIASDLFIV